jgi:hypothetical protein
MFPLDNEIFLELCINYEVNKFNCIFFNEANSNPEDTGFYFNDKQYKLFEINKKKFFNESLPNIEYTKYDLKNKINYDGINTDDEFCDENAFNKLLFKISRCNIEDIKFKKYKDQLTEFKMKKLSKIKFFSLIIQGFNINILFGDKYKRLYDYLLSIKVYNVCKILLNFIIKNELTNFCNSVKIYSELFNVKKYRFLYKFEALFELIAGVELLEEQMEKYIDIINKYIDYKNFKYVKIDKQYTLDLKNENKGVDYPLHHFMMGKGKTAVITPILMLYFSIIHNINVKIIVPSHLVSQTKKIINKYNIIFNVHPEILSDYEIKKVLILLVQL